MVKLETKHRGRGRAPHYVTSKCSAKTRAEIQKDYRDRKKAKIGLTAYNQVERARVKSYYKRAAELPEHILEERRMKSRLKMRFYRQKKKEEANLILNSLTIINNELESENGLESQALDLETGVDSQAAQATGEVTGFHSQTAQATGFETEFDSQTAQATGFETGFDSPAAQTTSFEIVSDSETLHTTSLVAGFEPPSVQLETGHESRTVSSTDLTDETGHGFDSSHLEPESLVSDDRTNQTI